MFHFCVCFKVAGWIILRLADNLTRQNYLPLSFSRSYHPSLSIKHILQATKSTVTLSIKPYKNEEGIEKIDIDQVG
jgi:hypothetical protein